ncbi:S1 family peptidase [Nocardia miyunensis]|uniref:S1 family peptidase n=1 Tax=Nocardia miyunensis TaxID=282684 RepID=UPI00350E5B3A
MGDRIGGEPYAVEGGGQGHRCSFGFNGVDAQGNTIDITAGHCDPDNLVAPAAKSVHQQPVYDLRNRKIGRRLGYFEATSFGPHDYSIIRIDDAEAARFRNNLVSTQRLGSASPAVAGRSIAARDNALRIDGTAEPVVGAAVCKSGSTSGYACGTVLSVRQRGRLGGVPGHGDRPVTIEDVFYSSICAQRGDSGGPIFAGTKAIGIISAIVTADAPADHGCGHSPVLLGQPISTVLADHPGVRIFTE